jgi:bifunctional non-homologous end joining protein LigD
MAKAGVKKAEKTTAPADKGPARERPAESAPDAVDEQLARYRSMRDFSITAEPAGASKIKKQGGTGYPFCVQKHAASHLHYDFRLGWNGVLKSWAVAKGPSYVVADKRLAVQVEDHPMEYGGFEGVIPAGQYGGGTVMLWDQGMWEPQAAYPDVDAGLKSGSLKFILHGTKLKGKWALIRMGGKHAGLASKPNWLLIKEHDDFERPASASAVTEDEPNSVITGRDLDAIAHSEDHVWNSKETAKPGQAWYRQESKAGGMSYVPPIAKARWMGHPGFAKLPKEEQPAFVTPQLAQQAENPPSSDGWLHELKLDGYRMQARKDSAGVRMLTRTGLDWTARMKAIAAEVAKLPVESATLDGEVVVLAADGTTSFANLQAAFQEGAKHPLTYSCFDLLHLNGRTTRELPLRERKELLAEILAQADPHVVHFCEHLESDGTVIFHKACEMHAEGIVSKRASAKYCAGRGSDWLKCKCLHEQEFVIGGYTLPSAGHAGMRGVGALLLGYYSSAAADGKAKLIYAGRVGTGFTQKTHKMLRDSLDPLARASTPFEQPPAEARKGAYWVKPELVAQVRFATWTADNLVRQAAFLGLREDKPAAHVVREDTAPTPKSSKPHSAAAKAASHAARTTAIAAKVATAAEHPPVRLTHPAKVLDAASGLSKQALADYYWAVAERMLPHIAGRPLSLVRCPEGTASQCFFQKHVTSALPPGVGSVDVPDKKTGKIEPYITLSTAEALAGLAQMGVLEVHPWGSRNDDLEHPDRLIFDLDPDESLPWSAVTEAAADVRARLKKLGLASFLKTTGGKGLHVVIPIEPTLDWATAKTFAHAFVVSMEKASPARYLTKMTKAARVGKIYLDYLRNERGATAVAAYSPRARAGVNVSMPLSWAELSSLERPIFSVTNFGEWRSRLGKDPWKIVSSTRQSISREALAGLGLNQ